MDGIVTIAWNDGSGDNLYLSLSGDSVEVTSDANWSGEERSKTLNFATTVGIASAQLVVTQSVGLSVVVISYGDDTIINRNDNIIGYGDN